MSGHFEMHVLQRLGSLLPKHAYAIELCKGDM